MDFLVPFITTFFLSFIAIKLANPFACKVGLIDLPNERKIHDGAVPLIGGIGIYLSVLLASTTFIEHSQTLNLYLISSALIMFVGMLDDKYDLSVRSRIVTQVIAASVLIFGVEVYLTSFGNIFYFFEFKLGYIGILITIFAVIGSINAFNMVDGIDGLAGALSIVTFSSLTYLFYQAHSPWFMLPFLFIAAIFAYLFFNLSWPLSSLDKVFMGDAGSMVIGLTVVWLLVIGTQGATPIFSPVTALYLIAIPLMDMVAIMYRRVKKGHSPFKPDRDHLHHIFERAGYNRKQTLIRITLVSAVLATTGIIAQIYLVPEWIMFLAFLAIFFFYNLALARIWLVLTWLKKSS